jgi:hypothetical protein
VNDDLRHGDVLSSGPVAPAPDGAGPVETYDLGELDVDFGEGLDEEFYEDTEQTRSRALLGIVAPESLAVTGLFLLALQLFGTQIIVRFAAKLTGATSRTANGEYNNAGVESLSSAYTTLTTLVAVLAVVAAVVALLRNRGEVRWVTGVAGATILVGLLLSVVLLVSSSTDLYGLF